MSTARPQAASSTVQWLLTLAGVAGTAGVFLPFAYNVSPVVAALNEELWRLAIPLFLVVPAVAASVRWIVSGSFSTAERVIAYLVSVAVACVTLSFLISDFTWPIDPHEWLTFLSAPSIFALGVFVLVHNSRIRIPAAFNPVMAIQLAYLANAVLCLVGFYGNWELGAYLVLTAVLAYTLQIILVSMRTESRLQDKLS